MKLNTDGHFEKATQFMLVILCIFGLTQLYLKKLLAQQCSSDRGALVAQMRLKITI